MLLCMSALRVSGCGRVKVWVTVRASVYVCLAY